LIVLHRIGLSDFSDCIQMLMHVCDCKNLYKAIEAAAACLLFQLQNLKPTIFTNIFCYIKIIVKI